MCSLIYAAISRTLEARVFGSTVPLRLALRNLYGMKRTTLWSSVAWAYVGRAADSCELVGKKKHCGMIVLSSVRCTVYPLVDKLCIYHLHLALAVQQRGETMIV